MQIDVRAGRLPDGLRAVSERHEGYWLIVVDDRLSDADALAAVVGELAAPQESRFST